MLCSIQRNRDRLRALGIPKLAKKLDSLVDSGQTKAPKPKNKRKHKSKAVKLEEDVIRIGPRRSSRLQVKSENPDEEKETVEEKFNRQLGEFLVNETCPKCGKVYQKGHKRHLINCSGPKSEQSRIASRDRELLSELNEEDLKDERKRMLARTKALNLDGLVDFNKEAATFIVIGSRGDPYSIKLSNSKNTCTCLDHRFRRHDCKHILLVLSQLGILDEPSLWYKAVEAHLGELVKKEEQSLHPDEIPESKSDAFKFI